MFATPRRIVSLALVLFAGLLASMPSALALGGEHQWLDQFSASAASHASTYDTDVALDSHGNVFAAFVAGGGFRGGHVVGASDAKAEEVRDRPVYPVDLLGSIYALSGIDAGAKLPHPLGTEAHVLPSVSETIRSAGLLTEIM